MNNKFLIGIGAAFFSVFVLGIAVVVGINAMTEQPSHPATAKLAEPSRLAGPSQAPEVQSPEQPAVSPLISPQATPVPVLDSDLAGLAAAVKLGETNTGGVSKDVWAQETPVAQKLLQGLCDCDQRNWLKHFVETGNQALSGSQDYYQSVQELAKLRRSNKELSAGQASH